MSITDQETVDRDEYDLSAAWALALSQYRATPGATWWGGPNRDDFLATVRRALTDPDEADVVWCESCQDPHWRDGTQELGDGGHACESCYEESYRGCDDCGTVVHYDDSYYVEGDSSVCSSCLDRNYRFCDECDVYYGEGYENEHRHGGCECESPAQHFAMRHGEGVVRQDERFVATLPAGVISEEGMRVIASLVRNYSYEAAAEVNPSSDYDGPVWEAANKIRNKWWNLSMEISSMDPHWQTREGNFTKRLSKLAHKSQGLKFPPALLTKVGNVARDHSAGADLQVEVTRDLNLPAEDFYHEDSCWWQSYSESRCSLKSNGGIGMRTFSEHGYVQGRAWIMPLRLDDRGNLRPTFDAVAADAFMVYNGYGDLSGYAPARIVADMTGLTYRKIGFGCDPQYINGNTGYLVATEGVAERYLTNGGLRIHTSIHSNLYHDEQAREAELVGA